MNQDVQDINQDIKRIVRIASKILAILTILIHT